MQDFLHQFNIEFVMHAAPKVVFLYSCKGVTDFLDVKVILYKTQYFPSVRLFVRFMVHSLEYETVLTGDFWGMTVFLKYKKLRG